MKRRRDKIEKEIRELIDAISSNRSTTDARKHLTPRLVAVGIDPSQQLADSFVKIVARLGGGEASNENLALLMLALLESPFPAGALVNLLRFLDTSSGPSSFLQTIASGQPIRDILATVFGTSQYMADIIVRNPGYLYWLLERQTWERVESKDSYLAALRTDVENFHTVETRLNAIRRFQRRMLLKIGVQDLMAARSIEETTKALSDLADAITECALSVLRPEILGEAADDGCGFAVLALGKLGGAELNYSSDIDLIYLCSEADDESIERYTRLARLLTAALSDVTAEGYLYRVDLRLRPDGKVGPIVSPLSAMMVYYEARGRPWEFQAMLKARVIAGDVELGRDFITRVSALTFSPSLSYSPREAIAAMRTRIRENISSRDRAYNIKLMEGGIRDIEFIVQTLQLLHGGSAPGLRSANTLESIERLHEAGRLEKIEHDTLTAAYLFLRLVEHRLQMMHQLKTHSIPQSVDEVSVLARRVSKGPLGQFGHDDFLTTLTNHLNKVRVISDSFFEEEALSESAVLLLLPESDDLAREALALHGLADVKQSLSIIQSLAYGSFPELLDRGARTSFQKLLPMLLEDLSAAPDPSQALVHFSRIVSGAHNRASLYNQLAESTPMRRLARDVAASSPLLAAKLAKQPELLGALAQSPERMLGESLDNIPWKALAESSEKQRAATEKVRTVIDRRELAAWVIDADRGALPATLAETVTRATRDIVTRVFASVVDDEHGIALLALGSFGVGEPRAGSDVDLLVVTKGRDLEPATRAVQQLNRMLTDTGLLKLDFRLRGEGANAPLVQDIDTYDRYFRDRMSPWEKVAFAKCAAWCGDMSLAQEFVALLAPHLTAPPDGQLLDALADTRRKLEGLVAPGAAALETKRSAGGRYDIEYLCALGMARAGKGAPALDMSTVGRLRAIADAGLVSRDELKVLEDATRLYARVECLIELSGEPLPSSPQRTQALAERIDKTLTLLGLRTSDDPLERTLTETRSAVRSCYERFLADVPRPGGSG